MMRFSNCHSVNLVSTRVEMPKPSEMDRITDALDRGMEEAVEDLRRERAGWPSLAVERELLAELKTFMGDQSASDQTSGAIVERHHHYHRLSGNIQWVLAGVFGVLLFIALCLLFR
jgi:hypothetical protein